MRIAAVITFTALGLMIGLYIWAGGCHNPSVSEIKSGPYTILAARHMGAYKEIGKALDKVTAAVQSSDIKPGPMIGVYYDDPNTVAEEKLRSAAGYLIKPDEAENILKKNHELIIVNLPERAYIRSEFPNQSPLSMIIGISKVYPAMGRYLNKNDYKSFTYKEEKYEDSYSLEIYHSDTIEYLMTRPEKN